MNRLYLFIFFIILELYAAGNAVVSRENGNRSFIFSSWGT